MPSNRREFLRTSGALCAGLMWLPSMGLDAQAAQPAAGPQSLERWLLGTGQSKIEPPIFTVVSDKLG